MTLVASIITDPAKLAELPFVLMEQVFSFTLSIMEQSFDFATQIGRLMV